MVFNCIVYILLKLIRLLYLIIIIFEIYNYIQCGYCKHNLFYRNADKWLKREVMLRYPIYLDIATQR